MPAAALRTCTCELAMKQTSNGLFFCENCDVPQEQEQTLQANGRPGTRKPTTSDRRFHLAWAQRMRETYGN